MSDIKSAQEAFNWGEYARVVVLSPHLDDALLSCFGLLNSVDDDVGRLVVTICSGNPAPVPRLERRPEEDPRRLASKYPQRPDERRLEDKRAMEAVGINYIQLGFADAIYRRSPTTGELIYDSPREKWVEPRIDDARHIEELFVVLSSLCQNLGRTLVVTPMGIGYHVDHAITAHVAMRLESEEVDLLFYEDFPYVVDPTIGKGIEDTPSNAMMRLRREPLQRYYIPTDADAKAEALEHYDSQIPLLFDNFDNLLPALTNRGFNGEPAEFFWTTRKRKS